MWEWFEIGETIRGVLIGGAITLVVTIVSQLLVGWHQSRQFRREANEKREVMLLQHKREDAVADRAHRVWVSQQMWERRVQAYDEALESLAKVEAGFQRTMNHALNSIGEESEHERMHGLEQAQAGMDALAQPSLYLNDRALEILGDLRKEILDTSRNLRGVRSRDSQNADMQLGAVGVAESRKAIKAIRLEGQEHLGDMQESP